MPRLTSLVFLAVLVALAVACGLMVGSPGCGAAASTLR
jgi:hypothetical protein